MSMEDKIPLAFGKHKGLCPEEIADIDPGYIVWLYDTKGPNECSRDLYVACSHAVEKKGVTRRVQFYSADRGDDEFGPEEDEEHRGWIDGWNHK